MHNVELENDIANELAKNSRARGMSLNDYLAEMLRMDKRRDEDSFERDLNELLAKLPSRTDLRAESHQQWAARLSSFVAKQTPAGHLVDDSRDAIYSDDE